MKKLLALLVVLTLVLGMLAGCGSSSSESAETASSAQETVSSVEEEPQEPEAEPEQPEEEPQESEEAEEPAEEPEQPEEEPAPEAEEPEEEPVHYDTMAEEYAAMSVETDHAYQAIQEGVTNPVSYPLADGAEISIWKIFSSFIWNGLMESYADMPILPDVEAATGVTVTFIEVSDAAASEQFNLTIASGDYPDLMGMDSYSGGATSAFEDEIIIDMTDLAEEYMPNYMAIVDTMDDYTLKSIYTDDGRILEVWSLVSNVVNEQGLSYRADWAQEFGMEEPVTIDDMFDYLSAAKSEYNCTYPIFIDNSAVLEGFTGAFGTAGVNLSSTDLGMMMDGDTVVSSLTDDAFRNYIAGFNRFYSAGLIKDDFYSESYGPDYINSYVTIDMCAVTTIRSDKFTSLTAAAESPTFTFSALAPLVETEGDTYKFVNKTSYTGNGRVSVTTGCDNVEAAMKFVNWFYTWDGYMIGNYGQEGVCFEYDENGNPVYTEFIVNNPDGYNTMNLRNMYTNPAFNNYQNATSIFYTYDEIELSAFDVWNNNGTDECSMPTMTLTTDESTEYANIATTVYTYATEQILKWMIGEAELTDDSWNAYVEQCNAMELPRAVEIYQGVYDRMYK